MRRTFADLHICPNTRDHKQILEVVRKASRLDYRLLAVPFPSSYTIADSEQLRATCQETGVDMATRVDLNPRTPNELTRALRQVRRRFEIVSVTCDSKDVSRQAAKDRRVDLLNFPSLDFRRRFFDFAEAELASSSLATLEIDMKSLLLSEGSTRIRLLTTLRKEVAIARDFHIPIILSSGVSDERLVRKPMELAALASLFDLDKESALEAVSRNPRAIVERNRKKLSSSYVAPGIRVVRRGKDC